MQQREQVGASAFGLRLTHELVEIGDVLDGVYVRAGVSLLTVGQGMIDWNDFASRMMYGIVQEAKNAFLHDLSRNVLRGRVDVFRRGGIATGRAHG